MSPNDVTVGSIVHVDPAWTEKGLGECLLIVTAVPAPEGMLVGLVTWPNAGSWTAQVPLDKVETTGGHVAWTTDAMNHGGENAHG